MNNLLLMLGALLVGILAALVAVPMVVDWNGYRGVFEEEASRLLGRDVRVGGAVAVRILPVPYVRFEKLRIADPSSTGGDPLFRADSVTMRLSLTPLLRGVMEAHSVELKQPSLRLSVDREGRGNWRALALKSGSLPFVPADVTLQSVEIEGGTLTLVGPSGRDLASFEKIDGEFAAEGIEGPFRFKGNANWFGEARELRVATAKAEADGSAKLRATLRVPANQNAYTFEGRLVDVQGRARVEGELTAKLQTGIGAAGQAGQAAQKSVDADANVIDFKSKVEGDMTGGRLMELALSMEQIADPQLITGEAKAAWGDALAFDMALSSRSLNIDRFSGKSGSSDPLEAARAALATVLQALPADADTDARLKADRVTLGGDVLSGVSLAMSRRSGELEVKELRGTLPGATRLEAAGIITREGKAHGFKGPVMIRGGNLARFLAWSRSDQARMPRATGQPQRYEGPFALEGWLAMTPNAVEITRAVAEFADQPLTGELRIVTDGRRRITVAVEGERIDAAVVWPGGLDLDRLRAFIAGSAPPATADGGSTGFFGLNTDTTDLKVELRAQDFAATPSIALKAVDAIFTIERGKLSMPRFKFASDSGLAVELEGQLAGLVRSATAVKPAIAELPSGAAPVPPHRGTVRFVIAAPTQAAMADLLRYLDWPAANRPSDAVLAALGPVRMAGAVAVGERSARAIDVSVDGSIDGGRVTGLARFDGGLAAWRLSPLDASATIETPSVGRWLELAGFVAPPSLTAGTEQAGTVAFTVKGLPANGVTVLATAASRALSLAYQGAMALPGSDAFTLDGTAAVTARDASDVVALVGLPLGQGPSSVPIEGRLAVKRTPRTLDFTNLELKAGSTTIGGRAVVRTPGGGDGAGAAREIDADIAVDTTTVAGLLTIISDRRQGTALSASGASAGQGRAPWPDQPVLLSGFDKLAGRVRLAAGKIEIDGPVALSNVRAELALAPGAITVSGLTGTGLGGALTGNLALQKALGSTGLSGDFTLTGGTYAAGDGAAALPVTVTASINGQGLSPSGMISALQGRGEAIIGPGPVRGVAPVGVAGVIDAMLVSKAPLTGEDLTETLRTALAPTALSLPQRKLGFTIADGIVRVPGAAFETGEGRAILESQVDLNGLRFVTDWRIEAMPRSGGSVKSRRALPAIILSTSGSLMNLAAAERKIIHLAFEQELVLRRIERDAEELERLRKLDEERRLKEEADKKAVEAATAAAEAGAAAAASTSSGAPAPPATSWVPVPVEAVRPAPATSTPLTGPGVPAVPAPPATTPPAQGVGGPLPADKAAAEPGTGPGSGSASPQAAAPTSRPPSQSSPDRRRTTDTFPQPFQNSF